MKVRTTLGILSLVVVLGATVSVQAQYPADIGDGFEPYIEGVSVVFRDPIWSGSTVSYDQMATDPPVEPNGIWGTDPEPPASPWNKSQIVTDIGATGSQCLEIFFMWGNPADTDDPPGFSGDPDTGGDDLIRCTTHSTAYLPRPSVHFGGTMTMKVALLGYSDDQYTKAYGSSLYLSFGVTETGKLVALGEEDSSGGDLEWVYPPGSEWIPTAGTNGLLPPLADGDAQPPYGKKILVTTTDNYPPLASDFQEITIDFSSADVRGWVGSDTAGDGVLDATSVGDFVNRGNLECLAISNDPDDTVGKFFFLYIDDIVFDSPEPDPPFAPTIEGPIDPCDTTVTVECADDATLATLYINDVEEESVVPSAGIATFNGDLVLNQGDVLTATQTMPGGVSDPSEPVVVENVESPTVEGPIYASDTSVIVSCFSESEAVELFINGISAGTASPSHGEATFNGISLSTFDVLTATQTKCAGQTSPMSGPVLVYQDTSWILVDDFDHYTSQDGFRQLWPNDVEPSDEEAQTLLAQGGAASCEQYMEAYNPAQTSAARSYKLFADGINGTDASPLWISFQMKLDSTSSATRFRFDLATDTAIPAASVSAAGSIGFGFTNGLGGDFATQYALFIQGHETLLDGFESDYFGVDYGLTGVAREANVWKTFQIEVLTSVVNYYIDGVNVNPAGYETGVPRAATDDFHYLMIGLNYSTNTAPVSLDDIQIVQGNVMLPYGGVFAPAAIAAAPNSPKIYTPVVPSETQISLDVDTNASLVEVQVNGTTVGSLSNPATPTVDIPISAVSDGEVITATQIIDGLSSCLSNPATVAVPKVSVSGPIDVGATSVTVYDIHPLASEVSVYVNDSYVGSANPAGSDTAVVSIPALITLDEVSATQTIVVEGPMGSRVVVGTTLVVNEFAYDNGPSSSESDDHYHFIEIYNYGGDLDISDWIIQVGDYVEDQIPPGVYYQHTVPSGTIIPANGFYTIAKEDVAGLPGAQVDFIDNDLVLENGMNYVALRTPRGALIDAVAYETNKGHFNGYEFIPEDIYSQIGAGIWGNAVTNISPLMSDGRWLDGLDTNENGRDWGLQKATPGYSNNPQDFTEHSDNYNSGTPGADITDWVGCYVNVRYFDPTVADSATNPTAISASPDGGLAAVFWDQAGGGDAHFLSLLPKEDVRFEGYAYIDDAVTLPAGYEEFKIGIRGTSDGLHNFDSYNGATGVCMLFQRFATGELSAYVLDETVGGLSVGSPRYAIILGGEYDLDEAGVAGWTRVLLETIGTNVRAIIGGTYGSDEGDFVLTASHESYGPGGYWISYREANGGGNGTTGCRPAQFDKITVTALDAVEPVDVTDVTSMAMHGATEYGIQVYPPSMINNRPYTCEPRYGLSANKLEIGLSDVITDASEITVTATNTSSEVVSATVALDPAGDKLIATFSPKLANKKIYTIDVAGDAVNDFQCEYVVLVGNLTNGGPQMNTVNAFDKSLVIARLGATIPTVGPNYDIANSGPSAGIINAFDKSMVIARLNDVAD